MATSNRREQQRNAESQILTLTSDGWFQCYTIPRRVTMTLFQCVYEDCFDKSGHLKKNCTDVSFVKKLIKRTDNAGSSLIINEKLILFIYCNIYGIN